jgi:transcriptional regulator with XRE-family HTH domain
MTHDVSAEQLKALRMAAGLELAVLARQVSLSTAQLMQLESGLDSLFYTPAIRRQAERKVYFHLTGQWPVDSERAASLEDQPTLGKEGGQEGAPPGPQVQPVAPPAEPAPAARPTRSRPWTASTVTRPGLIGSALLAGMGLAAWTVAGRPTAAPPAAPHPLVAHSTADPAARDAHQPAGPGAIAAARATDRSINKGPPSKASFDPEEDLVALLPPSGLPMVPASRAQAAPDLKCGAAIEPVVSLALPTPEAPLVRLVSAVSQTVCVTDGSGLSSQYRLAPGQSVLVAGAPPWLIQSGSLRQVQIEAQGVKLAWPAEMKNQVRLLGPH